MSNHVVPVILGGGSGTRLWPLSRTGFPKQFLCLTGDQSLFQLAVKRVLNIKTPALTVGDPIIVAGEEHRFLVLEQLREIGVETNSIVLEPVGRNTAPALTLAALQSLQDGNDPVLVVTPADQVIANVPAFNVAIQTAIREATTGAIVILGVPPDRPETGYGYIEIEKSDLSGADAHVVQRFVEKPDSATAETYLSAGNYFWNAGIFVLKASVWLKALESFRPDIDNAVQSAWQKHTVDQKFVRPDKEAFLAVPNESVDYAVIERCPGSAFDIKMVPLNAGWNDLGAWSAVWDTLPKDAHGNVHTGDVLVADTRNTLIHANSRLVSLVGVDNLIVIETPDAVLIADRSRSQDVKSIVAALKERKREEHQLHRKVHRPWGWYDSIDEGERFKVKRIQVKPGASLSLQFHHHRAEHWVVVKGTAEIVCGDKTIRLEENQSTYIPVGEKHRLTNPGAIPLEIIEVQSGGYLGEDDIVRVEDQYGRGS